MGYRESENLFLQQHFNKSENELIVCYGKKGIELTEFVKNFCKDKDMLYYYACPVSERQQRFNFAQNLSTENVKLTLYPTYEEIFNTLKMSFFDGRKRVLVIDNFTNILKNDETFIEAINKCILRNCSQKFLIILVSDSYGFVENDMLSKLNGYSNCLGGLLKLREFGFFEFCEFYKGFSKKDAIETISICGGYKKYLDLFDPELSLRENIIANFLNDGPIAKEIPLMINEALRETAVYNTILSALASGMDKLNDLHHHTDFARAKISVYLKNLAELGLVEKAYSFETNGVENTKKGVYRIVDNHIAFYYRFIFPNMSYINVYSAEEFYDRFIKDKLGEFLELGYKKICREYIASNYVTCGEWIGKSANIDILARDNDDRLLACACKYSDKFTSDDFEWLMYAISQAHVKPSNIFCFAEGGFDDRLLLENRDVKVRLLRFI